MNFGQGASLVVKANRTLQKRLRNPLKNRYKTNALKYTQKASSINIKKMSGSELEATKLRIQEEARKQRINQILIGLVVLAVIAILCWYGRGSIDWAKWMYYDQ